MVGSKHRDLTMTTVPRQGLVLGALLIGFGLSAPHAAVGGTDQLAQQPGSKQLLCQEVAQTFNIKGSDLNTRERNFLLFDAAERGCTDLVPGLIEAGASITARDRFGNTPLLIAARMGHRKIVTYLLDQGSDVRHPNLAGSTALIRAVSSNRRRTAKLLLEAGADIDAVNSKGISALMAASFNGNDRLVTLLLDNSADPGLVDRTGKGALIYAAGKGFTAIAAMLLDAGVEANTRYGNALTALMWAAGHSNDVPVAEGVETVRLLLARGARIDDADNRGRTPLMIAAERGHAEIVAVLIEAGADPARRDKDGKSAADLARDEALRQRLADATAPQ